MTDEQTTDPVVAETAQETPTEAATAPETAETEASQDAPVEQTAAEGQEAEQQETASEDAPEPEKKRKFNPITKRIEDLTAARRTAERAAQQSEARISELESKLEKYETAAPKLEDFDFDQDAYNAAMTAHTVKQLRKEELTDDVEAAKAASKAAAGETDGVTQQAYALRAQQFAETATDFADVIGSTAMQVSDAVGAQILASDMGPQIAYYMAKNPSEAADIASLQNPVDAARAIGRMEARLSQPPPKRTTNAPPPMKPIAGNVGAVPDFNPNTASVSEYEATLKKAGVI